MERIACQKSTISLGSVLLIETVIIASSQLTFAGAKFVTVRGIDQYYSGNVGLEKISNLRSHNRRAWFLPRDSSNGRQVRSLIRQ